MNQLLNYLLIVFKNAPMKLTYLTLLALPIIIFSCKDEPQENVVSIEDVMGETGEVIEEEVEYFEGGSSAVAAAEVTAIADVVALLRPFTHESVQEQAVDDNYTAGAGGLSASPLQDFGA